MKRTAKLAVALFLAVLGLATVPAAAQEALPRLSEVGPWPVVSRLIGYRGRLWLANSVKGRNHNSADLYSYEPLSGDLRYEQHLFSQDAGRPLVFAGRLYWPYEDSRASLGWGGVLVTDGEAWQAVTIPTADIFHVHAMSEADGRLVAATSAWRAGLQVSEDGGSSWRALYDHPTPERRVSRITELMAVNGRLLASLTQRDRRQVLVFDDAEPAALAGWPEDAVLKGWTRLAGWVYALVETAAGVAVWRSDGTRAEELAPPRPDWRARALAADGGALWAVSAEGDGGLLWHSRDGRTWAVARRIAGGRPYDVLAYRGFVFVGGAGEAGKGLLWGAPIAEQEIQDEAPAETALEEGPPSQASAADRQALVTRLEAALADPESYRGHGDRLRDLTYALAQTRPPAEVWRALLARPVPDLTLSLIGGKTTVAARGLARWILLWGMALSGSGAVPVDWLGAPWTDETNPAEKYYATAPMAIWAAARLGQDGRPTLEALMDRLARSDDPLWLRGDLVGALTALTGQRFGYDVAAWQAWWSERTE